MPQARGLRSNLSVLSFHPSTTMPAAAELVVIGSEERVSTDQRFV
jgi:hypothetical protein